MVKKLYSYITGKSVRQRVCICIVLTAVITLIVFTVKANFFGKPIADNAPQSEISEMTDTNENAVGEEPVKAPESSEPPQFHISLIDVIVLLAVIIAYCIHKFREKRKQRRL